MASSRKATILTGFCMHPSPGSHRWCDEIVRDESRSVECACDCHDDMAPFDEIDAAMRERYERMARGPLDDDEGPS